MAPVASGAPAAPVAAAADRSRFLPPGFESWRARARAYLRAGVVPDAARWEVSQLDLVSAAARPRARAGDGETALRVPREFLKLAITVACHRRDDRWHLLYRILFRLTHGEPHLLEVATDPDVHRASAMAKSVRRAAHKMKAFVRFRRVDDASVAERERYVAWFEPAHRVVERTAPFFARRFPSMRWSILTPDRCAHWDGATVSFSAGADRAGLPRDDALENLWCEYYANVFNPARLASRVMQAEMPMSYWKNLPEARLIGELSRNAPGRVARMIAAVAAPPLPLPDELRAHSAAGERQSPPRGLIASPRAALAAATRRRTALDIPSWDAVHDPGPEAARDRAEALHGASGGLLQVGAVAVLPGVAGWTDPTLLEPGVFYPPNATSAEARLRFYASRYAMVEVDSTYYVLPRREHAVAWVRRTPEQFVFNVKAHALMTTHAADVRRLPDGVRRMLPKSAVRDGAVYGSRLTEEMLDDVWARYLDALAPLQDAGKLGAVFLQFPRWFEPGAQSERWLRAAARRLGPVRGAVEFRNPDWLRDEPRTLGLLRDLNLAYTIVDAPPGTRSSMPPVVRLTRPDFAVVRLHGRRTATWEARNEFVTERYRYLYTREQVAATVRDVLGLASMMSRGMIQVSYNNNHANYATTNAAEFGEDLMPPREPYRDAWQRSLLRADGVQPELGV